MLRRATVPADETDTYASLALFPSKVTACSRKWTEFESDWHQHRRLETGSAMGYPVDSNHCQPMRWHEASYWVQGAEMSLVRRGGAQARTIMRVSGANHRQ
ncbi:hypothetical protein Tcan_11088 [Toxocara canis]|uniref:Uncharacterized protein n=1 Tax=Toxocara canis TaxID=6265 RepID=A0A0B2VVB1_TOXCA|nr:hypothetical protein Tcan_11088 [Toxocara canis]